MADMDRAVATLVHEQPGWVPVLEAAIAVSDRVEEHGGEFAGAWVIDELERLGAQQSWFPNLRLLVSYGFIEKVGDSTRGGRRAYYRFTAKGAVKRALSRISPREPQGQDEVGPRRRKFAFVASGESGQPGSDLGRQSSEIVYEPRSWR